MTKTMKIMGVNSFVLPGGTARLYLDTTPDKNYLTDFGFANEDVLITGTILGGLGTLTATGVGFESITVQVTGFDAAVYSPFTLIGANGIFTLDINSTSIQNVTSVQGHAFNPGTNMLIGADGNIKISAVPVPAAVWMLGSALVGMATIRRRPQG